MNRLFHVLVLLCSVMFICVGVASADTLQFTLAGPIPATFELSTPLSIMPSEAGLGAGFTLSPTMFTGLPAGEFITFYNSALGGGVGIFASGFNMIEYASGPQLYGGTELNPTFTPGTFLLADGTAANPVIGTYTLTTTDLSRVSTPESSVTILLAIGLFALGLTVLRFKPNFGVSAN
jgi:hypothetical protein